MAEIYSLIFICKNSSFDVICRTVQDISQLSR